MTETEQQIAKGLSRIADYPLSKMSSRVWHDAKVAGDDFAEFIKWFWETYRIPVPGEPKEYAPTEVQMWWHQISWPFQRKHSYRPLTIGDLATLAGRD